LLLEWYNVLSADIFYRLRFELSQKLCGKLLTASNFVRFTFQETELSTVEKEPADGASNIKLQMQVVDTIIAKLSS